MKRKYEEFLHDILEEISFIKLHTKSISLREFKENDLLTKAITKSLENIGEAVVNISSEIKEKYPNVAWKEIKDFRNIIVHKYWQIDYEAEWNIIETKLDLLESQISTILEKEL